MGRAAYDIHSHPAGRSRIATLAGVGWLCLALAGWLRAAELTATLDRDTLYLGETATLQVTLKGANRATAPTVPAVAGVQFVPQGQSTQMQVDNGAFSQSVTFNYALVPRQAGQITIPPFQLQLGAQTLATAPLKLTILKPTATPADAQREAQRLAFLRMVLPRTNLWLGEPVVAQLDLYVRNGVQNVSDFADPDFGGKGFTRGKLVQGQTRQVALNGVGFTILPFQVTVTPTVTGSLLLGPVSGSVVAHVQGQARGRDPFDIFRMMNPTRPERVALATEAIPVTVRALPAEGRPGDFTGAVGQFEMQASVGPTNVAVGDPITVKVALSGRGQIDQLSLPEFGAWRDFKSYPPVTKVDAPDQSLGLRGAKTFEVIVVPQHVDLRELPPIRFSYFDPDTGAYRTIERPATPLTVRPAGASGPVVTLPGLKPAEPKPEPEDIVPLKQRPGTLEAMPPVLITQPWFWAVQALPVTAWLGLLAWRKRLEALANNPRLRRRKEVDALLQEGYAELRTHAAGGNSEEFFAWLFRLMQERLGERLDLPASAITESVVDERLRGAGVPEETLRELHALFQRCNEARYAPVRDSRELGELVPALEKAMRAVEGSLV